MGVAASRLMGRLHKHAAGESRHLCRSLRLAVRHSAVVGRIPVTPQLLREVSAVCAATLRPAADRDWSVPAGELEWGCEDTLRHGISALAFYASHLATRSRGPLPFQHVEEPSLGITELLACLEIRGAILAELALGAPSDARGWHLMGLADAEGFLAMGCSEILIHTDDIASGLAALGFQPASSLVTPVASRLFLWAP